MEQTLAILKPDCVKRGLMGTVMARIEAAGFAVRAMRMVRLTEAQARAFYAVHAGKGFYEGLIAFMTEGACVALILERENAVDHWREVLVPLRDELAEDLTRNLVHGSDAPETSAFERGFFFAGWEMV
ncbi:MAG: nucleoside-diphosphate kinase [Armatimonadetes bacterium]|nr:nucleoside-diphosphate kinase [Armatimonadota bacterium]